MSYLLSQREMGSFKESSKGCAVVDMKELTQTSIKPAGLVAKQEDLRHVRHLATGKERERVKRQRKMRPSDLS